MFVVSIGSKILRVILLVFVVAHIEPNVLDAFVVDEFDDILVVDELGNDHESFAPVGHLFDLEDLRVSISGEIHSLGRACTARAFDGRGFAERGCYARFREALTAARRWRLANAWAGC